MIEKKASATPLALTCLLEKATVDQDLWKNQARGGVGEGYLGLALAYKWSARSTQLKGGRVQGWGIEEQQSKP